MCCQTRDILLLELPSSIIQQSVSSVSPRPVTTPLLLCTSPTASTSPTPPTSPVTWPPSQHQSYSHFNSLSFSQDWIFSGMIQCSPGLNYEEIYRLVMWGDRLEHYLHFVILHSHILPLPSNGLAQEYQHCLLTFLSKVGRAVQLGQLKSPNLSIEILRLRLLLGIYLILPNRLEVEVSWMCWYAEQSISAALHLWGITYFNSAVVQTYKWVLILKLGGGLTVRNLQLFKTKINKTFRAEHSRATNWTLCTTDTIPGENWL